MIKRDDLRPCGTVEVRCQVAGCGWAWWVDPLDPLLPDGPFLCHEHDPSYVQDTVRTVNFTEEDVRAYQEHVHARMSKKEQN